MSGKMVPVMSIWRWISPLCLTALLIPLSGCATAPPIVTTPPTAEMAWVRTDGVRRQHVLDRISGVRKGGFLAHRSQSRSEDETEIRDGKDALRTNHQRHSAGDAEALFG